jgi:hypothetical protein
MERGNFAVRSEGKPKGTLPQWGIIGDGSTSLFAGPIEGAGAGLEKEEDGIGMY